MTKPLEGIRVVELARILAGPWAGQTLADLGAEVIKVESPAGDDTRRWGPPYLGEGDSKTAAYYHSCNRGKKSVVIDFKTDQGLADLKALIASADVLIENYKVGGLKKHGLDYDSLAGENPALIYCSITGFGQTGPDADKAGYDFLMQGLSGLMSITGVADGPPQKVGVAITDIVTGLYSVIAIQAALAARATTGRGQHIDMALLDAATAVTANQAMNYLATGTAPKRMGNDHPNIAPYRVFELSDGYVILAIGNDGQFQRFCDIIGHAEFAEDARFITNEARVKNRDALIAAMEPVLLTWTKADLISACGQNAVPISPINDMDEVFANPQLIARGLRTDLDGYPSVRLPIVMSDSDIGATNAAPDLGADTEAVLSALRKQSG
ncbi:MAG: CaiB/BaiF CoA-transferase family protein [Pseudomonadota bacterium]